MDFFRRFYWFHATRLIATTMIFYGLLIEEDPGNKGTIIMAGAGLLGVEPVARRERRPAPRKDDGTG